MTDDAPLKADIYAMLEDYASTSVTKKISSIIELLKITAHVDELAPQTDRIHLASRMQTTSSSLWNQLNMSN